MRPKGIAGRIARIAVATALVGCGALAVTATPAGATVAPTRNVKYGPASGTANLLDIYRPAGLGLAPAVILIHGGDWTSGDKTDFSTDAGLLAKAGFVAITINYRLAPTYVYPAQIQDVQLAIAWVRAHAATYHIDPARIGLLGSSAGGQLAALASTYDSGPTNTGSRVMVAAMWSAEYDFTTFPEGNALNAGIQEYLGCSRGVCPTKWQQASAVTYVDPTDPPMFMANGTTERVPVDQPLEMMGRLDADSIHEQMQLVPGNQHGMQYQSQVWTQTVAFLQQYLG